MANKAENALWPLSELILFSEKDWWFIQYAVSNALEAKKGEKERNVEREKGKIREEEREGKKGSVNKVETVEKYRWKAGCDEGGGVPKLSTDPCRNRCIWSQQISGLEHKYIINKN